MLVTSYEIRRELAQSFDIDSPRTRDIAHGKIERRESHVLGKFLVPHRALIGAGYQLLKYWPARSFIRGECHGDVARICRQRLVESYCILHRKARSRTDGEMRRVQRVADEHAFAGAPMPVVHDGKPLPDRIARHERAPIQGLRKHAFTQRPCCVFVQLCKAGAYKCLFIDLNDERAEIRRVTVVMSIEKSQFGLDKRLG